MNRKWKICERSPGAATLIFLLALVGASPVIITRARSQERGVGARSSSAEGGVQTRRIALVIGNSKYVDKPLANAENDAIDMAAILGRLGFEVTQKTNQGEREMKLAISEFGKKLATGEGNVGLFYFAGHGIQVKGQNFMIPIDAAVTDEVEAEDACVNLELVLGKMEKSRKGLNIVILDACRDNPFRGWRSTVSDGLAYVNAPRGTLIAYATAPGRTASDGRGRNSPYTRALLRHIAQPNINILKMFELVRRDVEQETTEKQTPWESTSVTSGSEFYLAGVTAPAAPPAEIPAPVPTRPSFKLPLVSDPIDFAKLVKPVLYANSTIVPMLIVTNDLVPKLTQPFNFTTVSIEGLSKTKTVKQSTLMIEDLGNGVVIELVYIKGSTFTIGSPTTEYGRLKDEGPEKSFAIKPFLIGKYEVTQKLWETVASYSKISIDLNNSPSRFKGDNLPVEQISWSEAVEFVNRLNIKLNLKENEKYRLPTELEWEYVARAGSKTPFSFGDNISTEFVNYDGRYPYKSAAIGIFRNKTIPVGSLMIANNWGLYDIHGNVMEWCQDTYVENYSQYNNRDVRSGLEEQSLRVVRGGSWFRDATQCRSARRMWVDSSSKGVDIGFRLAKNL